MDIQKARRRDIPTLAKLLTQGFADDPLLAEYVARSRDPEVALERFFTTELEKFYIPRGVVDLVKDDGMIKGAALWVSPDAPIRRRDELRMFPGLVRALGRAYRARCASTITTPLPCRASRTGTSTQSWCPRKLRGRGSAVSCWITGLHAPVTIRSISESTTPGSRKLYERKGFFPLGVIPSPSESPEVGMWRPGRVVTG